MCFVDFTGNCLHQGSMKYLICTITTIFPGEIGEQYNISRQGVYDSIKKGREALRRYEEKLGLVKRFSRHNETIRNILTELKKLEAGSTQRENKDIIDFCVMELEKVINEL